MTEKSVKSTTAIDWILIAKGLGILLVVIGHFKPESAPGYWLTANEIIYLFHMPLFFVVSGFLHNEAKYGYWQLIRGKTQRLLYPFISVAVIFFIIKYVSGLVVKLDYPINAESLYQLAVYPVHSYMPLLWFVHALFLIFVIHPLLRKALGNPAILCLNVGLCWYLGGDAVNSIPVFGKALFFMPFFLIGVIFRENPQIAKYALNANPVYGPLLFTALLAAYFGYFTGSPEINVYVFRFLFGVTGTIFIINISKILCLNDNKLKLLLEKLGYYSMSIYLLHTLFESAVRIGAAQAVKLVSLPFPGVALTAIIAGVIFPLLIESLILRKFHFCRKFLLGIDK